MLFTFRDVILLILDWSLSARVLLSCTPGTINYTYLYPGYGKYTKMYPSDIRLYHSCIPAKNPMS
jgi:hypothetical protein